MKQPPKPFAIEIKRSRRPSASAPPASTSPIDLFGKDSSTLNGASAGHFSRREKVSNPAGASEFAVPVFLQTDRARRTSSDRLSAEVAQVFGPRPAPQPATSPFDQRNPSEARQPRILPSLALDDTVLDAVAETGARLPGAGQSRGLEASTRKPRSAAKTDRSEKINAPGKRRAAVIGAADIASKRKPAAAWSAAPAPASPAPLPAQNAAEGDGAHHGGNWRAARTRITRRGRDAAALPPGQHWKRRLNPRAW